MLKFALATATITIGLTALAAEYATLPNGNLISKDLNATEYVLESDDTADLFDESTDAPIPTLDASRQMRANRSPAILGPATTHPTGPRANLYLKAEESLLIPINNED